MRAALSTLRRPPAWVLAVALGVLLALPASASASAYSAVERAYSESDTIAPCQFSSATLNAALDQVPNFNYQYGADLSNAIQAALTARASGQCSATSPARRAVGGFGSAATLGGGPGQLPGSATAASGAGLPLVFIAAIVLAAVCLLGLAGWGLMNLLGYDPRLRRAVRQSLREAEYRMGAGWADLADRLRRQ